jgi:Holliday junction resolvase RusA-like endonuclease
VLDKLLFKHQPLKPLTCPLGIRIDAYLKVPKSYPKYKKAQCLEGAVLPTKTPDLDNIVKGILDRMQKCGYFKDDKQFCALHATKRYDKRPRVEIEIWEVKPHAV